MTGTRTLISLVTVLAVLASPLHADNIEMIGGSFVWSDPGTWNNLNGGPDHPPGPADTAIFDFTTFGYNFFLDVDATCLALNFDGGSSTWISLPSETQRQLTVQATMRVEGDVLQLISLDLDTNSMKIYNGAQLFASGVNLGAHFGIDIGAVNPPAGPGSMSVSGGSLTTVLAVYVGGADDDGSLTLNNTVADIGLLVIPRSFVPGSGAGQVDVLGGTTLTPQHVYIATEADSGAVGQLHLSGPGTVLDTEGFHVEVGAVSGTTGSLIMDDHARLLLPEQALLLVRNTGSVDVSGGAEIMLADELTIDRGTLTTNGGGLEMIGVDPEIRVETYGLLDISGSFTFGSISDPPSHPTIIVSGIGEVRIEDHWRMGSTAGSFAHMQIFGVDANGASSRLLGTPAASDLLVGDVGSAHLELTGGGLVKDFRAAVVGNLSNASGTLTVTGEGGLGTGSQLRVDDTLYIAGGPTPGVENAEGDATISDGGRVIAGTVVLAQSTGCEATLIIGDAPPAAAGSTQPASLVTSSTIQVGGQGTAELTLWGNGSIDAGGQVQVLPGSSLTMGGGHLGSEGDIVIGPSLCSSGDDGGIVAGHGTLAVDIGDAVICCGRIRPGGLIDVAGSYTHWGVLEVELGGTVAGVDYGQVAVTDTAVLSGRVEVTLADGYVPLPGSTYDVLVASATLEDEFVPVQFTLPPDMTGQVLPDRITITALDPCAADLDGNGTIDTVDFLDLLAQWGTNPGGPPDFNLDGTVDTVDFLTLLSKWGPCP